MTIIHVDRASDWFSVEADGHAGADRNEHGHDLVCCAISTLICTLANSCAQLQGPATVYHTLDGFARLTVSNTRTCPDEVRARLQMLLDGLHALEVQYPQNIRLKIHD